MSRCSGPARGEGTVARNQARLRYGAPVPTERTEERTRGERDTGGPALHAALFLLLECARPLAGGMRISLAQTDEVILGRADARRVERVREGGKAIVRVGIPDRRMSVEHARITLASGAATLEDLGSTNGVRFGNAALDHAALRNGKVFELGQTLFLYAEIEERPSWRTTDLDSESATATLPGLLTLHPLHAGAAWSA